MPPSSAPTRRWRITMTSKEPRFSRGGRSASRSANWNGQCRSAMGGELGAGWYARTAGGLRRSEGFAVSRVEGAGIQRRVRTRRLRRLSPAGGGAVRRGGHTVFFGGVRFDEYWPTVCSHGGRHAHGGFGVFQGRRTAGQGDRHGGRRPWARFSVKGDRFGGDGHLRRLLRTVGIRGLTTGNPFNSNSYRPAGGRAGKPKFSPGTRFRGLAAHGGRREDGQLQSRGQRTDISLPADRVGQAGAVRPGHVERHQRVKVLLAVRGDRSSLHDFQLSPKGSVTY